MVQSLGISVGNANSYVAAGQGGGIEMLLNEYSNRSTPSMVAFTDHSRSIGVDASSNVFMNIKNTVYDLMLLLGKSYKEITQFIQDNRLTYSFKLEEDQDGRALVVVRHLGEERKFTITQLLAMLLTKLRGVAYGSTDCVLSCPQFFNETQKAALVQAALIAGLNPLQVISDMSAVVLNYAYYRTKKEDTNKFIAFINFGQSNLQTVIAELVPQEDVVRILAADHELIGGTDFDKTLANHFVETCKLNLTPKSYLKLVSSCEKLKKLLSANPNEIPLHVESLISEDEDFTARIDRATFELLSQNLLNRVEACFKRTLESAKAAMGEAELKLEIVEMVGGSIRVPAIKHLAETVFGLPPSTTLNTDEAVTRGCVLHCATLHPGMKVKREVKILGTCDSELNRNQELHLEEELRVERDLIESDKKYKNATEARNTLEEYIYTARSKLQDGDPILVQLNDTLEWLDGDLGSAEDYGKKLTELKKVTEKPLPAEKSNGKPQEKSDKQEEKTEKPEAKVDEKAGDHSDTPMDSSQ